MVLSADIDATFESFMKICKQLAEIKEFDLYERQMKLAQEFVDLSFVVQRISAPQRDLWNSRLSKLENKINKSR